MFSSISQTYAMLQPQSTQVLGTTGSPGSSCCNQMKNKGMNIVLMLQRGFICCLLKIYASCAESMTPDLTLTLQKNYEHICTSSLQQLSISHQVTMTTFILSIPESRLAIVLSQLKRKYREGVDEDGLLGDYRDIAKACRGGVREASVQLGLQLATYMNINKSFLMDISKRSETKENVGSLPS